MSVTSGFFNSVNHDRLYDAEQVSSLFDGIIIDGVYQNYGDGFRVVSNSEVNDSIIVKTGRAWFDHTWTYNDSDLVIQLDPPNTMLQRVDAIVIDVNREQNTRKNNVLYIKGTFGQDTPPELVNTDLHKQYPLAYISFPAGESAVIPQSRITNKIGSEECPVVTGVLEALNLDMYYQQLKSEFDNWWNGIKDILDENTATKLQNQINELTGKVEKVDGDFFNIDVYDKLINCSVSSVSYIDKVQDSGYNYTPEGAFFLPDKKMAWIHHTRSDQDGIINFFDPDSKVVVSTEIFETKSSSVGSFVTFLFCDFNSFPCKITYLAKSVKYGSNGRVSNHIVDVYNITITEQHSISLSKVSSQVVESIDSSYIGDSNPGIKWSSVPAYYDDGSAAMIFYDTTKSSASSGPISYFGIKVSKDGTVANISQKTKSYDSLGNMAILFMVKGGDFIYSCGNAFDFSGYCYFIDPLTFQIVHYFKYNDEEFVSLWPKNYLDIYRSNSETVYSYKSPNELIKFSGNTYNYEILKLKPRLVCSHITNSSRDQERATIVGDETGKYLIRNLGSRYGIANIDDKMGLDYYFYSNDGGSDIHFSAFNNLVYGSSSKLEQLVYSLDTSNYTYKDFKNIVDAGPAFSIDNVKSIVSSDGTHIYCTTNLSIGFLNKPINTVNSSGVYNTPSYLYPFHGIFDTDAHNEVSTKYDYLIDIYIGG